MNWIQKTTLFGTFPPRGRYLIGVSGGRDSVALLHHLVDLGYKKLVVCHLNHQLRGRSSNVDANFVKQLAESYDVDVEVGSENVRTLANKKKMSIETAGREARYSFFARVAKRIRCRKIFLAHHADDLVETTVINLFRGSGATGLAAMREVSKRRLLDNDLTIIRPLLGVWRTEIEAYVHKHRLKFREDSSNKNLAPLRNRIRRQVIPYLEKKVSRNIRRSIWRTGMILAEEESWLEKQLSKPGQLHVAYATQNCPYLSVEKLRDLPVALQRRQILKWLRVQNIANIGFDVVEKVRALLSPGARVAKINLSENRHVRRRAKKIFIEG